MNILKNIFKYLILGSIGGAIYIVIELLYRGYTHWSMFCVAFFAFILIGLINEFISWNISLWKQMLIGSGIVTVLEFISGYILNIKLGLHI